MKKSSNGLAEEANRSGITIPLTLPIETIFRLRKRANGEDLESFIPFFLAQGVRTPEPKKSSRHDRKTIADK